MITVVWKKWYCKSWFLEYTAWGDQDEGGIKITLNMTLENLQEFFRWAFMQGILLLSVLVRVIYNYTHTPSV
uniref:Uncharacterized protein n=1 Tax=Arion vulgaris TaxID=1028688 RepID=A0A0B7A8H2_9EUPU